MTHSFLQKSRFLSTERSSVRVAIFCKVDEIGGLVALIIDAESIYRSRAWWTNIEKGGEKGNKTARAKRTEVNNGGGGVVGAMRRPQSTVVPRGYIL